MTYLKPKLSPILLPLIVEYCNIQSSIHSLIHFFNNQILVQSKVITCIDLNFWYFKLHAVLTMIMSLNICLRSRRKKGLTWKHYAIVALL